MLLLAVVEGLADRDPTPSEIPSIGLASASRARTV
jgi:hypothetical protein